MFAQAVNTDLALTYHTIKTEFDGNNIKYHGFNKKINASTSVSDWIIVKRTFTGGTASNLFNASETRYGAWDNRDTLGWSI